MCLHRDQKGRRVRIPTTLANCETTIFIYTSTQWSV